MAGPKGILRLSVSSIKKYFQCPMSWYFQYVLHIPQKTDYPRLCGVEVHRFIARLYKDVPYNRKFWYKSIDSARKAWFVTWKKSLEENEDKIIGPNKEQAKKYSAIGAVCIENYWRDNLKSPNPIYIEKRYTIPWSRGVELTGVIDQLRSAKPNWMRKKRPDLFANGTLLKGYSDNLVVDLKTGWGDYNLDDTKTTDEEKIRKQISIQLDIQAAAYALLLQKHTEKFPFAFILYQLRHSDENMYVVEGDLEGPQNVLRESIDHVVKNVRDGSFPRHIGRHCAFCDYAVECKGLTNTNISDSDNLQSVLNPENSEGIIPEPKPVQLKLKFGKNPSKKTSD
jgi:CRISPR/Cas system-associated exonuclease Cas4 (RecB family)